MSAGESKSDAVGSFFARMFGVFADQRWRLAYLGIFVILLIIAGSNVVTEKSPGLAFNAASSRSDFDDYYQAAVLLSQGRDPYRLEAIRVMHSLNASATSELLRRAGEGDKKALDTLLEIRRIGSYIYPPFFAVLLLPLSHLSYASAAFVFQAVSIMALFLFAWMYCRYSGQALHQAQTALILSSIFTFVFLQENYSKGNIGFFLILLCGGALLFGFSASLGLELLGGLLLGLAAGIKVFPVLLVLVFFAYGRFVAIVGTIVGLSISFLFSGLVLGFEDNLRLSVDWYQLIVASYDQTGIVRPWANNQTVSAAMAKMFIPNSDAKQPLFGLPLLDATSNRYFSPVMVQYVIRCVNAGLLISVMASAVAIFMGMALGKRLWRRLVFRIFDRRDLAVNGFLPMVFLAALLSSGVSWYHAYSLLFLPLVFFFSRGSREINSGEGWTFLLLSLFVFSVVQTILPFPWRDAIALYSCFVWVMLVCFFRFLWSFWVQAKSSEGA